MKELTLLSVMILLVSCGSGKNNNVVDPKTKSQQELNTKSQQVVIPSELLGKWTYNSEETDNSQYDIYEFASDKSFSQTIQRQVGTEGTDIPYPTICRYRQTGKIFEIGTPDDRTKEYYRNRENSAVPSHTFSFFVNKVELIENEDNDEACALFIKEQESSISDSTLGLMYNTDILIKSDDEIFLVHNEESYFKVR